MVVDAGVLGKMRAAYRRLFRSNDPFSEPFIDEIRNRVILCPTDGYFLTKEQYLALTSSARAFGEESYYVSEVEGGPDFLTPAEHWQLAIGTPYDQYCSLPIVLENAIYSESARWAVIVSHEEHALYGCTDEVIREFKSALPTWGEGTPACLRMWEQNKVDYRSEVDWIRMLLAHVGQSRY